MKKHLFLLVAIFFTKYVAYSQDNNYILKKGDVFINGSIGFQNTTINKYNENTIDFSPRVGAFISSKFLIGLQVGFGQKKATDSVVLSNKSILNLGAFTRYYFTPEKQFSVFTNLSADYTSENDQLSKKIDNKYEISVSPGVHYFISKDFLLEATLGKIAIGSSKSNAASSPKIDKFDLSVNISSIELGLTYKIGKR